VTLLPGLTRETLGRELGAGVTLLALAVPLNIGYAQIAGLPPTAGLYALVVPAVVYALTTSSRQLVVAPDAAAAALIASSVGGLAVAGSDDYVELVLAQAVLCGAAFLVMSVLRLGFLADFLSQPILCGFVAGLALEVLVSQVAKMAGLRLDPEDGLFRHVVHLVSHADQAQVASVALAALSLAISLVGRRVARQVPWALVVLVVATVLTDAGHLDRHGVAVVGEVRGGLPTVHWPSVDPGRWAALVPSALGLTLITVAEGLLVARTYSQRHGYPDNPDRNLLAFGLANAAAGVTGGLAMGSSVSRTAATDQAGSRSQLPTLVAAAGAVALLVFGTGLLEQLPLPAVGAVVALAVLPLVDVRYLRRLARLSGFEFGVALTCLFGAVVLGPLRGIALAFVLSLVNLARRASRPAVDALSATGEPAWSLYGPTGAPTYGDVLVVRIAAPLFFANATRLDAAVRGAAANVTGLHYLVLDLEAVSDVDVTAAEALDRLRRDLVADGVGVGYSRVSPGVLDRLRHFDLVGDSPVFPTNRAALAEYARTEPGGG
jgi:high affinity sulfate transporter 1